jgi:transcriptional regulator with XRE-family HTH domain
MLKNFVRDVREKRGLSQLKLSRIAEIAPGTISNIENGKVFVYEGWKKRLAEALEVPQNELFPEDEEV